MADTNMKILVVDDFSTMRRIVKNVLKQLGFTNMEFQRKYIEAVDDKIKLIKRKRIYAKFEICYTIEETLLTALAVKDNMTIKKLCPCAYIHLQGKEKVY